MSLEVVEVCLGGELCVHAVPAVVPVVCAARADLGPDVFLGCGEALAGDGPFVAAEELAGEACDAVEVGLAGEAEGVLPGALVVGGEPDARGQAVGPVIADPGAIGIAEGVEIERGIGELRRQRPAPMAPNAS
ncbi:hypothetical protein M1D80_04460 (plasmid) [Phyllobacteriaceae bacterium JZ32]